MKRLLISVCIVIGWMLVWWSVFYMWTTQFQSLALVWTVLISIDSIRLLLKGVFRFDDYLKQKRRQKHLTRLSTDDRILLELPMDNPR